MSGGKETLKGSMYSGIYISLILRFVLSTRKEAQNSVKREKYSGKEPLKGWYVRYSDFHISINSSAPEGGIDELWEFCYIPLDLFGYWFRSVKQKVESEMSDEKKA